jgi:hypothetical protein
MTGALTWNANGTLQKLAITDGFNSGGTQTCNFNPSAATGTGYDDLLRLVGVDCGSGGWGQTFSYDDYDNLSKAVIAGHTGTTWNPGYSSTTNHYSGGTYDSNGNVTSDGNFVYGWNEFSKLKWSAASGTPTCGTSGHCIVYDAFGRIVETSVNSTWKEWWYTQLGETANMSGTTINFAYWPAPHGGKVLTNGPNGAVYYLHPDWKQNVRLASLVTTHTVGMDQAFAPYGEAYSIFGTVTNQENQFAGMTENFYSGAMWDTPNRELSSVGRWLSPDPAGAGWNQYAYGTNPNGGTDRSGLAWYTINGTITMNPYGPVYYAMSGGDTTGISWYMKPTTPPDPTTPALCFCPEDMTSGAMAGTAQPLPPGIAGPLPPVYSVGAPAGIQIVGFLFEYNGPNGIWNVSTNSPLVQPMVGSVPVGATIDVNVWLEQIVDAEGLPVIPGNYAVQENLTKLSGNLNVQGGSWPSDGSFVDNIGVPPDLLTSGFGFSRTRQTFSVNGVPLSTVFNQYVLYGQGTLGMAFPMNCPCNP